MQLISVERDSKSLVYLQTKPNDEGRLIEFYDIATKITINNLTFCSLNFEELWRVIQLLKGCLLVFYIINK